MVARCRWSLDFFARGVDEGLAGAVGRATGALITVWRGAVHTVVDRAAGVVCDTGVLIIVEVAAGEWSTVWAITLGHASSGVAAVFDDGGGANWADWSSDVAENFTLAGWSNLVRWHTGVAVEVTDKVAKAATVCVACGSLNALASSFVAVTAFLAHAIVGAGLWDTSVALVALKAHSAGLICASILIVTGPRTYASTALLVAEATAWALCIGDTNVVAAFRNTA